MFCNQNCFEKAYMKIQTVYDYFARSNKKSILHNTVFSNAWNVIWLNISKILTTPSVVTCTMGKDIHTNLKYAQSYRINIRDKDFGLKCNGKDGQRTWYENFAECYILLELKYLKVISKTDYYCNNL